MGERERRNSNRPTNAQLPLPPPSLAINTDLRSPAPSFASPWTAPPPSPVLAWAPSEEKLGDVEKVQMERRVLIRGEGAQREDTQPQFYNRLSMAMHKNSDLSDAEWLRKQQSKTGSTRKKVWLAGVAVILIIALVVSLVCICKYYLPLCFSLCCSSTRQRRLILQRC
jgi:hypothetical protein